MPFRRSAGAAPTSTACKNALAFLQAVLPSVSLGRNPRESPEVGRVYQRQRLILKGDINIQGKAAPTRATPNTFGFGLDVPQRIKVLADRSAKKSDHRTKQIPRFDKSSFSFVDFSVREFCHFAKMTLENTDPSCAIIST
jgi:hypothetical protein